MVADDKAKLQVVTSVGNVAVTDFEAGFFGCLLRGFTQVCYAKMRKQQGEYLVDKLAGNTGDLYRKLEEKLQPQNLKELKTRIYAGKRSIAKTPMLLLRPKNSDQAFVP